MDGSARGGGDGGRGGEGLDPELRVNLSREVDDAVFDHHADGLDRFELAGWVARDQEEVRRLAFLDGAQRLIASGVPRRLQRRARQDLGRGHADPLIELELAVEGEGSAGAPPRADA